MVKDGGHDSGFAASHVVEHPPDQRAIVNRDRGVAHKVEVIERWDNIALFHVRIAIVSLGGDLDPLEQGCSELGRGEFAQSRKTVVRDTRIAELIE